MLVKSTLRILVRATICLAIFTVSITAHASVTTYSSRSVYNSAVAGYGTATDIDFSTKDDGTPISNPASDVYIDPLVLRGVAFNGARSYYNSHIYNFASPAVTTANLPPYTYAFGLDLSSFYGLDGTFTITLSSGEEFQVNRINSAVYFFGVTSNTPIQWAQFSYDNDYIVLDNFTYTASSGLISYWPGEGDALDVIGGNNGMFQNGEAYAPGTIGQAFSLNGINYIEVPDSPSLSITGPFTLSASINLNSNTTQQAIIEKYDVPGRNGYLFRLEAGKLVSTVCDPSGCSQPPARGATTVTIGTWHHVAAVYDGTSIRVYLDGMLDGSSAASFSPTDGATSLKIGARGDDANTRLNGLIDEVRIYNRALSISEIAALANTDSTAPVISPLIVGTLGNNGWYTGDVEVSWSVSDGESAISSSTGCDTSNVTTDTSGITFTCSATSAGGTETQSVTVKRDAFAPAIACDSADGLWHATDVLIACTASDGTSGLANSGDANFDLTTNVASGVETDNAATDSRQVCDLAGNCGTAGPFTGNRVDKKPPTISITSPLAGSYLLNQSVTVAFTCNDGGSGVADCTGTAANGGSLDTGSVGAKTFTVSATDNVGNDALPLVVNYSANFGVTVLFDQTKARKAGSTIPIKLQLVDANGANVSSSSTIVQALSVIQVSSQASANLDDAGNSNPDFNFRYDAGLGGYIFNLKTTGYGTGSYLLNFTAGDSPTVYSVGFQTRQ